MRSSKLIAKLDELKDRFDSLGMNSDPSELDGTEDCEIGAASLAVECLKEAIIHEAAISESVRSAQAKIRYYESQMAEKKQRFEAMRKELCAFQKEVNSQMESLGEKLKEVEVEFSCKVHALNNIKAEFGRYNLTEMPGEFVAGATEGLGNMVRFRKQMGLPIDIIFMSSEDRPHSIKDVTAAHVEGIPVRFFNEIKKNTFIFFAPATHQSTKQK